MDDTWDTLVLGNLQLFSSKPNGQWQHAKRKNEDHEVGKSGTGWLREGFP